MTNLPYVGEISSAKIKLDEAHALKQLQKMHCKIEKRRLAPNLWMTQKLMRYLMNGLFVEQSGIKSVKKLIDMNEKVILLPQYRSFADLFILLYTLSNYGIQLPFTVGNQEDTPNIGSI